MRKVKELPSSEYLNECLTYDPITGELFWKERPRSHFKTQSGWIIFNKNYSGTVAGTKQYKKSGQPANISIGISDSNGKPRVFLAHRIIYRLMNIEVPLGMMVDHHNRNAFENWWGNLRIATNGQNQSNRIRRRIKNDLPKGVSITPYGKFVAAMTHDKKGVYIGSFDTPEQAHAAYCAKSTELNGEFARHN